MQSKPRRERVLTARFLPLTKDKCFNAGEAGAGPAIEALQKLENKFSKIKHVALTIFINRFLLGQKRHNRGFKITTLRT